MVGRRLDEQRRVTRCRGGLANRLWLAGVLMLESVAGELPRLGGLLEKLPFGAVGRRRCDRRVEEAPLVPLNLPQKPCLLAMIRRRV